MALGHWLVHPDPGFSGLGTFFCWGEGVLHVVIMQHQSPKQILWGEASVL